jgi:cephalosporin hydroxylase
MTHSDSQTSSKAFKDASNEYIRKMSADTELQTLSREWIDKTATHRYVYNWAWMNLPIIQFPQDVVATHELIYACNPSIIVETGVARGGSIVFDASQLALLDIKESGCFDVNKTSRKVIGIDIKITAENSKALTEHPLAPMITLIEGSSIAASVFQSVCAAVLYDSVDMIILDSNHSHEHVYSELCLYSSLLKTNGILIVHDTGIEFANEDLPLFRDRPWARGNNPHTALSKFLAENKNFEFLENACGKLLITSSPSGYLRKKY